MTTKPTTASDTKVMVGGPDNLVRFSYLHVFKAVAVQEGSAEKFSVSLIIPKSDKKTIAKIKAGINAAIEQGKTSKWKGKLPKDLKTPLKDGDEEREDDEVYENSYFINANCTKKPGVVNKKKVPITDEEEIYSGCYGIASVNFYPYDTAGNKGIACGLNNIMKIKDGDFLGGRASAESDFEDVEIEDDEDDIDPME
jgi:hypothetical protein